MNKLDQLAAEAKRLVREHGALRASDEEASAAIDRLRLAASRQPAATSEPKPLTAEEIELVRRLKKIWHVDSTLEIFTEGIRFAEERAALAHQPAEAEPIDMVLHCPNCGTQHIDAPEEHEYDDARGHLRMSCDWTNPPHRSHLCHACEHVWRPADVPTNGVAAVKTAGKADSPIVQPAASQEGDGKPQSLGRAVADALRPYLGEGERVIWQEPFRWHDDSGLLPNHYEMFGLPSLAADFGYEVIHDCGCAGVIRDAARDGGAN